ncbi:hypothetical protein M1N07_03280 [Thermodesulfovibrionales bacterium]|nr:hypothetical protein [Thermodesulfovibrionales bacterium]
MKTSEIRLCFCLFEILPEKSDLPLNMSGSIIPSGIENEMKRISNCSGCQEVLGDLIGWKVSIIANVC